LADADRLLRALDDGVLPDLPTLMIRPGGDARLVSALTAPPTVWQPFLPHLEILRAAGAQQVDRVAGSFPQVMVCLARSRTATEADIAAAWDATDDGGRIIVSGQKTNGIDAILKAFRAIVPADEVIAKAHGKLAVFTRNGRLPDPFRAWADRGVPSRNADGFLTAPGIFSADGVDPGSALLAQHVTADMKGEMADLGAGWGWLSLQALSIAPGISALHMVEADRIALDLARQNVSDNRAQAHWADATRWDPGARMDWVISNPPFHTGRSADPSLGQAFLRSAARLLKPSGRALVVANRQLPYESTLAECFGRVEVLEQTGQYKLFRLSAPGRTSGR